jgi:hypothetical protein
MGVHRSPRVLRTGAALCLLTGLLGAWPVGGASAGCTGPRLGVGSAVDEAPVAGSQRAPALEPGTGVTVSGLRFHSGCDDTGQGSGCGAPESEQAPLRGVRLVLERGTTEVPLGTADAGDRADGYAVTWRVQVPTGLAPGPAVLRAADARLPVTLRP